MNAMKKLSFILTLFGLLAVTTGYAKKPERIMASTTLSTKEFPGIAKFDSIRNYGDIDVNIRQSTDNSTKISLSGASNFLEFVKVENNDGTLEVRFETPRHAIVEDYKKLQLNVTCPNVSKIDVAGSGDINMYGIINVQSFTADVTGSGDFNCERMTCQNTMAVTISGSGDAQVDNLKCSMFNFTNTGSGEMEVGVLEVPMANIHLEGSGDFDCDTMISKEIAATTLQSGDIEIENLTVETLVAFTKGSGSITLKGEAMDVDLETAGSGGISAIGLKSVSVEARSGGSGDITCYVLKSIDAKTSGSGTIMYSGNPMEVKTEGRIKTK